MKFQVTGSVDNLIKEYFWLAYDAAGGLGARGMGRLQARAAVDKEQVFANVKCCGDYPLNTNKPGDLYADYVFGRMLKVGIRFRENVVEIRNDETDLGYQAWCMVYPTYEKLLHAAAIEANCELEKITC